MFGDVTDLCGSTAKCLRHKGRQCPIRFAHVASSGWSCKDIALINVNAREASGDCLSHGSGTSRQTWLGTVGYAQTHRPRRLIGENSDQLADQKKPNYTTVKKTFSEMGFASDIVLVDSKKHGNPHRRPRSYIPTFDQGGGDDFLKRGEQHVSAIAQMIKNLEIDPLDLSEFILPKDSDYLKEELASRLEPSFNYQLIFALSNRSSKAMLSVPGPPTYR